MNERIRELAEQATSHMPGHPPYDDLTFDVFDKEKFTELIVGECVGVCDRFQARDVGMQPAECAGAIRKMFGVDK